MLTLSPFLFHKNSNPSKTSETMFLLARVLPLVRILAILDHIWGSKGLKTFFVDAESVCKTLKIFNLTTANAILMKLTTIMYLRESVNRKARRGRNSVFRLNF